MNSRLGVTATEDMAVLPGVLRCRTLRRTVQVGLGSNTLHAAQAPALRVVARLHGHLHGLATGIHEISGLSRCSELSGGILFGSSISQIPQEKVKLSYEGDELQ